jgi:hypothetical protein
MDFSRREPELKGVTLVREDIADAARNPAIG